MVMLGGILNCERDLQRENPKYEILVSRGKEEWAPSHPQRRGEKPPT